MDWKYLRIWYNVYCKRYCITSMKESIVMTDFVNGDIVKYRFGGEIRVGEVSKITAKRVEILDCESCDYVTVPKESIETFENIVLDKKTFSKLARYEITLKDLAEDYRYREIENADKYKITLEDLLCVLKKIVFKNISRFDFGEDWLAFFDKLPKECLEESNCFYGRAEMSSDIIDNLEFWVYQNFDINFKLLIDDVKRFLEDEKKPLRKRCFKENAKKMLLLKMQNDLYLNSASEDECKLYKQFVLEFSKQGDIEALEALGYGCYGGNRVFDCDWKKSEKCLLKLFDIVEDNAAKACYANTLGYIYYYGRTSNGVPDYEKAYKYFSFASFNGIYEATYKIADMYKNGYGVMKSAETAENIITKLYNENIKYIQNGEFDTKFADIALRMGDFCKDEDIEYSDFEQMLMYYYQARFAIRMRMKEKNYYGDESVARAIDEQIKQTKDYMDFKEQKKVQVDSLLSLLGDYLKDGRMLDVKVTELANGKYKLVFKPHKLKNNKTTNRLFITIPELEMCGFYDSLAVVIEPLNDFIVYPMLDSFTIDSITDDGLCFDGEIYFYFAEYDCIFEIKKPKTEDKTYRFISIELPVHISYDVLCDNENIKPGDKITVQLLNNRSVEGTVTKIFEKKETETKYPIKTYVKM